VRGACHGSAVRQQGFGEDGQGRRLLACARGQCR